MKASYACNSELCQCEQDISAKETLVPWMNKVFVHFGNFNRHQTYGSGQTAGLVVWRWVSGHRWGKKTRSSDQTYGLGLTKHYRWKLRAQMVHLLAGGQRWMVKCREFEYYVKERKTHLCKQINNPSSPVTFLGCRNDILHSFSVFFCIRRSLTVPSQDSSRVNYFFSLSGCLREQTGGAVWANQQAYIYQPPLSFHLGG